jgi:hypothetical protein
MTRDELDLAIERLIDGDLAAGERARLAQALRADPSLLQEVRDHLHLAAAVGTSSRRKGDLAERLSWVVTGRRVTASGRSIEAAVQERIQRQGALRRRWRAAVAAAAILVLVPVAWLVLRTRSSPPAGPIVATLAQMADAVWEAGEPGRQAGAELAPGRLRLRQGLAQVDFFSGARVVLKGPADFEIQGPLSAALQRGKAACEVVASARGFQLRAPGVVVKDLGTAFGLWVREGGATEVHVLEGRVLVSPEAAGRPVELKAASAVRVSPEGILETRFEPDAFPRPPDLKARRQAEASARLKAWRSACDALEADPALLLHYRLDGDPDGKKAVNRASKAPPDTDGLIVGASRGEGRWPGKSSLEFRGRADRLLARLPGFHENLTLGVWLRVDALVNPLAGILMTVEPERWERFGPPLGPAREAAAAQRTSSPCQAVRWEIGRNGQVYFNTALQDSRDATGGRWVQHFTAQPVLPRARWGQWVFVATVVTGKKGRVIHYIDGEAVQTVASSQQEPLPPLLLDFVEIGNLAASADEEKLGVRYEFLGALDELMIAARAFSPDEIRRLYEAGRP